MVTKSYTKPAYERLKFYQNACEIRRLIYKITEKFPNNCLRLVGQMRDAARSTKQNIREGYCKDSAREFAHYIKISRGSLEELEGDVDDCLEDNLIDNNNFALLKQLIGQTSYLIDKYLDSLYKMDEQKTWKTRFK